MDPNFSQRLQRAASSLSDKVGARVDLALMTGTGLGGLLDRVKAETRISYSDIDDFPHSTSPGHKGELVIGTLAGKRIAVLDGRFHLFEGWKPDDVVMPIYLAQRLGAKTFIVTNAAGALNPDYDVADVMLIEDHLNFLGANPLIGENDDNLGVRFPDMSRAYAPHLKELAASVAKEQGLNLRQGIYVSVPGPSLETSAERRYLRNSGADAVGMSTVLEVIAANHCGLDVLGFSAISNSATGGVDQQPDTVEDVLEHAAIAGRKIEQLIFDLVGKLK